MPSADPPIDPRMSPAHSNPPAIDPELQKSSKDNEPEADPYPLRFTPEEESALLSASHAQKSQANTLFSRSEYSQAVTTYSEALASCPNYLDYEIAVLKSNIAACHIKLADWKAAVENATAALEGLERLEPSGPRKESTDGGDMKNKADKSADTVVELDASDPATEEEQLSKLQLSDERKADIQRIRVKALMRRAKAKSELGGWANLQGAEEDYKLLSQLPSSSLPPADRKIVHAALSALPARAAAAKEKEVGEMMGKLKELGNGILKPFGLSTDNFKMTKDEKSGGYSMQFSQDR